jgi:UDP-N-acetylglucosamine 4,6-dehydratase
MSVNRNNLDFGSGVLLITGGTGSFGRAVIDRILSNPIKEIRILSRDEEKQHQLRMVYDNPKLRFYIGDVRDPQSLIDAFRGVEYVFHAAALKQVPSCEFFPMEAVKTNVLGTENVLNIAIAQRVKKVVCLSTDKAVYPINAMGMTKGLMEKIIVAKSRNSNETKIVCTRYGNVMSSRGSVIPMFFDQIKQNKSLSVTDPSMSRFMMTLSEAVDLVLYAFANGSSGDIFVQKAPSAKVGDVALAMKQLYSYYGEINEIGIRNGEKLHETLVTREEMAVAIETDRYYQIPSPLNNLNYNQFLSEGVPDRKQVKEYNSESTQRLSVSEIIELLKSIGYEGQIG